jgi:RNA polymerase sigma-70 factor (ECF subfamily)
MGANSALTPGSDWQAATRQRAPVTRRLDGERSRPCNCAYIHDKLDLLSLGCVSSEGGIRALCEAGAFSEAATRVLESHGPEVMSFLVAVTRDEARADDAFSLFCLALWQGLPGFRWQSSLRTWLYVLARSALGRLARERAAAKKEVPISSELAAAMVAVRSSHVYSTDKRDRMAELRESLDPDDRMLIILRLNRELSWSDVARVMLAAEDPPPEEIDRAAIGLRKRWQRLKQELRRELERKPR